MPKILVIESDTELLESYRNVFSPENIELVAASDGEEGLRRAYEEKPSLILLDLALPKMSGFQVLLRLKSNTDTKAIPVIILSGLANMKDIKSCLYIGAVKYLVKSENEPKSVLGIVKNTLGMV